VLYKYIVMTSVIYVNTNIEKFWNVIKSEQIEYLRMVLSLPHPFTYLVEDISEISSYYFSL